MLTFSQRPSTLLGVPSFAQAFDHVRAILRPDIPFSNFRFSGNAGFHLSHHRQ
jgi:hypothetical protein